MELNGIDIVIIIVLGASAIYSTVKGFVKDIFSLLAVILGIVAALVFYRMSAQLLEDVIASEEIRNTLSFAVIFLVVAVAVSIAGILVSKLIKSVELTFYDRLAGFAFGLLKGFLIVAVVVVVAISIMPRAAANSQLVPYVARAVDLVTDILPSEYRDSVDDTRDRLREFGDAIPEQEGASP
ncbi:MAG: CvpA family protein [Deltaproteobacteria bacterium]|nr:CvpA family protein [Candidatus Zymogenaceae bacterium]